MFFKVGNPCHKFRCRYEGLFLSPYHSPPIQSIRDSGQLSPQNILGPDHFGYLHHCPPLKSWSLHRCHGNTLLPAPVLAPDICPPPCEKPKSLQRPVTPRPTPEVSGADLPGRAAHGRTLAAGHTDARNTPYISVLEGFAEPMCFSGPANCRLSQRTSLLAAS